MYPRGGPVFDWDAGNRDKCGKHGLEIAQVEQVLRSDPTIFPDPFGSERRFRAVGRTPEGRRVLVVFTLRERGGATLVRPISARYMHAREVQSYEQEAPAQLPDR